MDIGTPIKDDDADDSYTDREYDLQELMTDVNNYKNKNKNKKKNNKKTKTKKKNNNNKTNRARLRYMLKVVPPDV